MPITFAVKRELGYFIATYSGRLADNDLIKPWNDFFADYEWDPNLNQLADISELDGEEITSGGVLRLAKFIETALKERRNSVMKIAVYSPHDLPFGLARMYEGMSDESIQKLYVFRERKEAEAWLAKQ